MSAPTAALPLDPVDPVGDRPAIMSRQEWGAKPALPGMRPQRITGIVLHHTGFPKKSSLSMKAKMHNLQTFSQQPGEVSPQHSKPAWPDVPYHFYIDASGHIAEGRDMNFAGDTNTGYNTSGYIQIVLEGDFDKEKPDQAQLEALRGLLNWLLVSYKLSRESITSHKDHAPTTCPGRFFMSALPGLLSKLSTSIRP
jgi:hypothetical protein